MTIATFRDETFRFRWLHCEDPAVEELEDLAVKYGLHATSVRACLEPEHHPKIEFFENSLFIVLRFYDAQASSDATSVRALTRKLAIFATDDLILTVSRTSQKSVSDLIGRWTQKALSAKFDTLPHLISEFIRASEYSFEQPLLSLQQALERLEERAVEASDTSDFLSQAICLRRRASVIYRVTSQIAIVARECMTHFKSSESSYFRHAAENCERLMFNTDQVADDIEDMIQLNMSLSSQRMTQSSHKTNEVMRLLTVFSVFFMPLNLIAGIYGMNFDNMPGLHHASGFSLILGLMALIGFAAYSWFRRRGWLQDHH